MGKAVAVSCVAQCLLFRVSVRLFVIKRRATWFFYKHQITDSRFSNSRLLIHRLQITLNYELLDVGAAIFLPNLSAVWARGWASWFIFPHLYSRPVMRIHCHTDKGPGTRPKKVLYHWVIPGRGWPEMAGGWTGFLTPLKMGKGFWLQNGRQEEKQEYGENIISPKIPTNWLDSHFNVFWSLDAMFN